MSKKKIFPVWVLLWIAFCGLKPDYVPTPEEVDRFYTTSVLVV
jgi:hypothetical protein